MEAFISWIIEQVMQQGLSMSLLALAVWYFNKRQAMLEAKLEKANNDIVLYLKEDRQQLISLMDDNREVMAEVKEAVKRLDYKLS